MNQCADAIRIYTDLSKYTGYTEVDPSFANIAQRLEDSKNPLVLGVYYDNTSTDHDLAVYGFNTENNINYLYAYDPRGYECSGNFEYFDDDDEVDCTGMSYFQTGQW